MFEPFASRINKGLRFLTIPIVDFWERLGLIKPTLVATCDFSHAWESDTEVFEETITFYLLEFPSGNRTFKVHEYGECEINFAHEKYLKDILTWSYGGPLPRQARKVGNATVLEVIRNEAEE